MLSILCFTLGLFIGILIGLFICVMIMAGDDE